jgi:regulator of replication initiation timing
MEDKDFAVEVFNKMSALHDSFREVSGKVSNMETNLAHVVKDIDKKEVENKELREKKETDCAKHRDRLEELEKFKVRCETENNLSTNTRKLFDLETGKREDKSEQKGEDKAYFTIKEVVLFVIVIITFFLALIPWTGHSELRAERPPANTSTK